MCICIYIKYMYMYVCFTNFTTYQRFVANKSVILHSFLGGYACTITCIHKHANMYTYLFRNTNVVFHSTCLIYSWISIHTYMYVHSHIHICICICVWGYG